MHPQTERALRQAVIDLREEAELLQKERDLARWFAAQWEWAARWHCENPIECADYRPPH